MRDELKELLAGNLTEAEARLGPLLAEATDNLTLEDLLGPADAGPTCSLIQKARADAALERYINAVPGRK